MNSRRSNLSMSNSSDYRIDLNSSSNDLDQTETMGEEILHQIHSLPTNHPSPTTNNSTTRPSPGPVVTDVTNDHLHQLIQFLKENLTSTLPFALILLLKAFYEHSAGIFMVIFFSASIYHSNSVLVHQVSLKSCRQMIPIFRVIFILTLSLIVFLYLFRDQKFYNCLIFLDPNYSKWDLWILLWVIYSTFCIVKMCVMILKSLIILIPLTNEKGRSCLKSRERGTYFALIEYFSQYYISLLTIRPWIHFLLDQSETKSYFSTFLLVFYVIVKAFNLWKSTKTLIQSIKQSFQILPFPSVSNQEIKDNVCPICQSEHQNPIQLTCKHIFCEECVLSWIDRNASCPLCRYKLPIGQTNYRDGFTSGYLIWY